MAAKTLYVGNLSYGTTESSLTNHFAEYGASNPRIIEGRGFGFVDVDGEKLEAAVSEKNQTEFEGRTIVVNEARPKGEGGGSGGGRSGGYGNRGRGRY